MLKKVEDILNKIQHLKDLRQAMKIVRDAEQQTSLNKEEKKADKKDQKEAAIIGLDPLLGLQHAGIEIGKGGIITHTLKHPHNRAVYKIHVDMGRPEPIFTVAHFDGDEPKELAPDFFNNIEKAVKAATTHFHKKAWK